MKVKVTRKFRVTGETWRYPGEEITVSKRMAEKLIRRGMVREVIEESETQEEFPTEEAESEGEDEPDPSAWTRKPCGGCPKRKK